MNANEMNGMTYMSPELTLIELEAVVPLAQSGSNTESFTWDPEEDF